MSNVGNWRPCEYGGVFSFITTFTYGFRLITRSMVNLQQNHQGAKVWGNAIIPSSKGIDFKTGVHLLWCGFSSQGCCINIKSKDVFWGRLFIHLRSLRPVRCGHAWRHNLKQKKGIFNQTKSTTNVWGTCDIERRIVIYRSRIKKGNV